MSQAPYSDSDGDGLLGAALRDTDEGGVADAVSRTATATEPQSRSSNQCRPAPVQRGRKRGASLVLRLLVVAVTVVFGSLLGAGSASAVSHAGGWSPYLPATGPWNYSDCSIYAGVAVDNVHAAPNFHHFGAGGVYCSRPHTIAITVRQYRYAYGVVQEAGTPGSFGPYYSNNVYVPTGPACKNGDKYAQFETAVFVTIDGVQLGWKYGNWNQNSSQGCMYL